MCVCGGGGFIKNSQCFGKSCFVCIDICGHDCRWWYLCLRPIIKVYLLVAETACVRELKVILMLVLGQHECVRGEFYININKLVFSKSV